MAISISGGITSSPMNGTVGTVSVGIPGLSELSPMQALKKVGGIVGDALTKAGSELTQAGLSLAGKLGTPAGGMNFGPGPIMPTGGALSPPNVNPLGFTPASGGGQSTTSMPPGFGGGRNLPTGGSSSPPNVNPLGFTPSPDGGPSTTTMSPGLGPIAEGQHGRHHHMDLKMATTEMSKALSQYGGETLTRADVHAIANGQVPANAPAGAKPPSYDMQDAAQHLLDHSGQYRRLETADAANSGGNTTPDGVIGAGDINAELGKFGSAGGTAALKTLSQHPQSLFGKDLTGRASVQTLRNVASGIDVGGGTVTQELRHAASQVLSNPALLKQLDTAQNVAGSQANPTGDGQFSLGDLQLVLTRGNSGS